MAATSNHNGDVAIWIEKVINSCETSQQEASARKLVRLFEERLLREGKGLYSEYSRKLRNLLDQKFYTRIEKMQEDANAN
jgi:hypothetical protein